MTVYDAGVKPRLCCADAWTGYCDDPEPHAVRWARRTDRFRDAVWGKWHYTEGNALFTACGENIVPFEVDGSPEEREIEAVTCKRCLSKMARFNSGISGAKASDGLTRYDHA